MFIFLENAEVGLCARFCLLSFPPLRLQSARQATHQPSPFSSRGTPGSAEHGSLAVMAPGPPGMSHKLIRHHPHLPRL